MFYFQKIILKQFILPVLCFTDYFRSKSVESVRYVRYTLGFFNTYQSSKSM